MDKWDIEIVMWCDNCDNILTVENLKVLYKYE